MIRPDWLYQSPDVIGFFGTFPAPLWAEQKVIVVQAAMPMWAIMLIGVCFIQCVSGLIWLGLALSAKPAADEIHSEAKAADRP